MTADRDRWASGVLREQGYCGYITKLGVACIRPPGHDGGHPMTPRDRLAAAFHATTSKTHQQDTERSQYDPWCTERAAAMLAADLRIGEALSEDAERQRALGAAVEQAFAQHPDWSFSHSDVGDQWFANLEPGDAVVQADSLPEAIDAALEAKP